MSKACHSLCLWVHAMYNFYFVNLKVKPKMQALAEAELSLQATELALAEANAHLRTIEEGLDKLQSLLRQEEDRKAELESQKTLCEERMSRAIRLIAGLADEQVRWVQTVASLKGSLKNCIGDILLSAGVTLFFLFIFL